VREVGEEHLGLGALAVVLLAGFVAREATAAQPLVPLRIFRNRNATAANAVQMLMVAGMLGMFFLGALYLQRVLGYGALDVGLAFLPVAVAIAALSLCLIVALTVLSTKASLAMGLPV